MHALLPSGLCRGTSAHVGGGLGSAAWMQHRPSHPQPVWPWQAAAPPSLNLPVCEMECVTFSISWQSQGLSEVPRKGDRPPTWLRLSDC